MEINSWMSIEIVNYALIDRKHIGMKLANEILNHNAWDLHDIFTVAEYLQATTNY